MQLADFTQTELGAWCSRRSVSVYINNIKALEFLMVFMLSEGMSAWGAVGSDHFTSEGISSLASLLSIQVRKYQ